MAFSFSLLLDYDNVLHFVIRIQRLSPALQRPFFRGIIVNILTFLRERGGHEGRANIQGFTERGSNEAIYHPDNNPAPCSSFNLLDKKSPPRKMVSKEMVPGSTAMKFERRNLDIVQRISSGETLTAIGKDYDLSRERIRQIGLMYGVTYNRKRDSATCETCGKVFPRDAGAILKNQRYCSPQCFHKVNKSAIKPEGKYSKYGYVTLKCKGCGKEFNRTKHYHQTVKATRRLQCGKEPKDFYCNVGCFLETMRRK